MEDFKFKISLNIKYSIGSPDATFVIGVIQTLLKGKHHTYGFSQEIGVLQNGRHQKTYLQKASYTLLVRLMARNLSIEHGLSKLETSYSQVVSKIIKNKQISIDEHAILCLFVSAMYERTPFQRDHWREQWGNLYSEMDEMKKEFEQGSSEQKTQMRNAVRLSDGPKFTMDDVQRRAENTLQEMMVPRIKSRISIYQR